MDGGRGMILQSVSMKAEVDFDAFSIGQMRSKLWLCERLESVGFKSPLRIELLAGWYGMLGFLLLCRERLPVARIRSHDVDAGAVELANRFNKKWVADGAKFHATVGDIRTLTYEDRPDLVINTSTEHVAGDAWWEAIPARTWVALQGTDQVHPTHVRAFRDLKDFAAAFPLSETVFRDELRFDFPDKSFRRFMLIGRK